MESIRQNSIGGFSILAFIIVLTISMAYFQFVYLPQINAKPHVAEEILHPASASHVSIEEGSSLPSNPQFFVPKEARGSLGVSNKVVWTNHDKTAHTITTDTGYVDKISGPFDTMKTEGVGLLAPGKTFEFIFTEEGEFPYHCEPHPWMVGKVKIVKDFS